MRNFDRFSAAVLICGCALFLFATPVPAVNCDKNPNHKDCPDGGGGGGDYSVVLTLRDAATDKITSDVSGTGAITYTDGEPGVSARIREDGMLMFNITDPDRGLNLDFSDQAQAPECTQAPCKKDFSEINSANYPPGAQATVQVFDEGTDCNNATGQHRADQFIGMKINERLCGEMKLGFGGAKNSTRFSVRFQALGVGAIDTNIAEKSSYLEVTRTAQDTWTIEAVVPSNINAGHNALLFSNFKKKGTVNQDEGTYQMPFHITASCSTCP